MKQLPANSPVTIVEVQPVSSLPPFVYREYIVLLYIVSKSAGQHTRETLSKYSVKTQISNWEAIKIKDGYIRG